MAKRLTQIAISKIRPAATRREVPDAGKPGLYLVIQPSGKKSWAVRYRFRGQSRKYTLPGFPSLPLAHRQAQVSSIRLRKGSILLRRSGYRQRRRATTYSETSPATLSSATSSSTIPNAMAAMS
jgi:hypothetical protein